MKYKATLSIILCTLLAASHGLECPIDDGDGANNTALIDGGGLLEKLFNFCINDERCTTVYHQNYRTNITVFRHLVSGEQLRHNLYEPIRDLLCNGYEIEEINAKLWIMAMISASFGGSHPQCDVNHHLVFDQNGLRSQCVCNADRICSDALYDLIPFYILVILVTFLSLVFFVANIYRNVRILQVLDKVASSRNGDMSGILALNKALT